MIIGRKINLRDIETADANFVLSLRCNEKKSKHLHKTENDIKTDSSVDYTIIIGPMYEL